MKHVLNLGSIALVLLAGAPLAFADGAAVPQTTSSDVGGANVDLTNAFEPGTLTVRNHEVRAEVAGSRTTDGQFGGSTQLQIDFPVTINGRQSREMNDGFTINPGGRVRVDVNQHGQLERLEVESPSLSAYRLQGTSWNGTPPAARVREINQQIAQATRARDAADQAGNQGEANNQQARIDSLNQQLNTPSSTGAFELLRTEYEHRSNAATGLRSDAARVSVFNLSGHVTSHIRGTPITLDFCASIAPLIVRLGALQIQNLQANASLGMDVMACIGTQLGQVGHLRGQVDWSGEWVFANGSYTGADSMGNPEQISNQSRDQVASATAAIDDIGGSGVGVFYRAEHASTTANSSTSSTSGVTTQFVGIQGVY